MKMICRKCGFEFDVENFAQLEEIQEAKCGSYSTHRLVGIL
jgi:predicted Zn-ribbon and HTH transcriptional regulator|tara:strand:+ start:231 stop:353 length:123 start_codon:yes stop_codon:yes gene_type:complete